MNQSNKYISDAHIAGVYIFSAVLEPSVVLIVASAGKNWVIIQGVVVHDAVWLIFMYKHLCHLHPPFTEILLGKGTLTQPQVKEDREEKERRRKLFNTWRSNGPFCGYLMNAWKFVGSMFNVSASDWGDGGGVEFAKGMSYGKWECNLIILTQQRAIRLGIRRGCGRIVDYVPRIIIINYRSRRSPFPCKKGRKFNKDNVEECVPGAA